MPFRRLAMVQAVLALIGARTALIQSILAFIRTKIAMCLAILALNKARTVMRQAIRAVLAIIKAFLALTGARIALIAQSTHKQKLVQPMHTKPCKLTYNVWHETTVKVQDKLSFKPEYKKL